MSSKFTEKIDVLDLLINIIREHEEKLDELVERLEATVAVCLETSVIKDLSEVRGGMMGLKDLTLEDAS